MRVFSRRTVGEIAHVVDDTAIVVDQYTCKGDLSKLISLREEP